MMLKPNLPSFSDPEGSHAPREMPTIIDAHVHVFPKTVFSAIWKWFDDNAWPIRYRMSTGEVFDFLLSRGVRHMVALQYAHKPGIARHLNQYLARKCKACPDGVTGMATVYPGEENAEGVLQEAFDQGLGGLKLHAHVQCFHMNSDIMNPLYECCRTNRKPIIMHVGREPKSTAYRCDPHEICSVESLERVLKDFPDLRVCVPHLGLDEITAYRSLLEKYDNLWLDTTMVVTDYFPLVENVELTAYRWNRVMYGSDFPNIPYAWDRELKKIKALNLPSKFLEMLLSENAADFFSLDLKTRTSPV